MEYPDNWIHVYTDGSAFKGTVNAGLGARIEYPDGSLEEIAIPCGSLCSNFDAEAHAMISAIYSIKGTFDMNPEISTNAVIFTDSKSVLECLHNNSVPTSAIRDLIQTIDSFHKDYGHEITLQWIPSHCNINGNEAADKLAKEGAMMHQPDKPVPQRTCKQIIKSNIQIEWVNGWALDKTGRKIFPFMPKPLKNDPLNKLERKEQSVIFRLRTQHAPLNYHLNRINPMHEPLCPLCDHAYETTDHFLFECPNLKDIRQELLPSMPDIDNTLYGDVCQLIKTSKYYFMAQRRRAKAHNQAG